MMPVGSVSESLRIRSSLGLPYVRTLLLPYALMTPGWYFLVVLLGPVDGSNFTLAMVLLSVTLLAVLAWVSVAPVAVWISVDEYGVTVLERTLRAGHPNSRTLEWSRIGPRVIYGRLVGTVAILLSDPPGVLALTTAQARTILESPHCRVTNVPPKLAAKLGHVR